ncbi:MAG: PKD domain-containing protein [Halobacteriota archaeon]
MFAVALDAAAVYKIQSRDDTKVGMILVKRSPTAGLIILIVVAAILAAGCATNTSQNNTGSNTAQQLPIANAGADQKVKAGSAVSLNGSGSNAPRGGTLTYDWSLSSAPKNSTAHLVNQSSNHAAFTPDMAGTYIVSLVVTDSTGAKSVPDTTNITAISGERVATKLTDIQSSKTDNLYLGDVVVTTGRLVDADGNGIPNQIITFRSIARVPLFGSRDVSPGSVMTDSTGAFRKVNDPVSSNGAPSFIGTVTVEGWIEYAGNDVYQPTSTSHHQVTVHLTAPPSS